ncbi:hypothetical protein D3C87_1680740 [compost metagenome]
MLQPGLVRDVDDIVPGMDAVFQGNASHPRLVDFALGPRRAIDRIQLRRDVPDQRKFPGGVGRQGLLHQRHPPQPQRQEQPSVAAQLPVHFPKVQATLALRRLRFPAQGTQTHSVRIGPKPDKADTTGQERKPDR